MKITYIHHNSFLVKLDYTLLLFGYTDGPLPYPNQQKELAFLFSQRKNIGEGNLLERFESPRKKMG